MRLGERVRVGGRHRNLSLTRTRLRTPNPTLIFLALTSDREIITPAFAAWAPRLRLRREYPRTNSLSASRRLRGCFHSHRNLIDTSAIIAKTVPKSQKRVTTCCSDQPFN